MTGRIYWAQLERLDPSGNPAGVIWRFDANDYPGTGTVYTDPRGRTWTLSSSSAITTAVVVGPDVPQAALRFPTTTEFDTEELAGTGIFYARPIDYSTVELTWGTVLDLAKWNEVGDRALGVRDAPHCQRGPDDLPRHAGQAVSAAAIPWSRSQRASRPSRSWRARKLYDPRSMPGVGAQVALPNGRWYYYSLFFRSGLKWKRFMTTQTLLPRNYFHAEHLFNSLPPYYQWTDDQMRGGKGDGDLRRYLRLVGYDLDLTREYVNGWLDLYHTDFTPLALLRRLGANFGVPYEVGIGDIRYRGLISKLGSLYRSRGTTRSLQEMAVSVLKCTVDLTSSTNIMLLPDDSDFFEGTGSWAGIHPETPLENMVIPGTWPIGTVLTPDKIRLEHGVHVIRPPDNTGRGVMRMWTAKADATADVFLTCGDGIAQDWDTNIPLDRTDDTFEGIRVLYPRFSGIPITPQEIYSFSIRSRPTSSPRPCARSSCGSTLPATTTTSSASVDTAPGPIDHLNWEMYSVQGIAPANAAYAVPALWIRNRIAGSDPDLLAVPLLRCRPVHRSSAPRPPSPPPRRIATSR